MPSETESKVIDILVKCGVTRDAWMEPIYAVDRAMGWGTDQTVKFVHDLMHRKLIRVNPIVREGGVYDPKSSWEKVT
ncbi:MAG: hypothetical protein ABL967_16345 [Bryobacteraceae bacterium]